MQQIGGKPRTANIRVDITVEGVTNDHPWSCGFEFDYSNEESFVCRPLRLPDYEDVPVKDAKFSTVPSEAQSVRVAYLPPMSGLAADEPKWEPGRINVLLGQGQTAQVLRDLCTKSTSVATENRRQRGRTSLLVLRVSSVLTCCRQNTLRSRGEITMEYLENGTSLDLSSCGRGLQQSLLLLAHLYANPQTVLLLDEPDAHLEILRQRQTYQLLSEIAAQQQSQIIAASHSEVVLIEAAGRGKVVALRRKATHDERPW